MWTSVLRTKAGHPFYHRNHEWTSTFTIHDDGDHCKHMLFRLGYREAARWKQRTTFHIDVVTTEGALNEAEFYLNAEQLKKVRISAPSPRRAEPKGDRRFLFLKAPHRNIDISSRMMLIRDYHQAQLYSCLNKLPNAATSGGVHNVSILVRVSSIYEKPQMSLFVDPWTMVAEGKALLLNGAHYGLKLVGQTPQHIDIGQIITQEPLNSPGQRPSVRDWARNLFGGWGLWGTGMSQISSLQSVVAYNYRSLEDRAFRHIRLLVLAPGRPDDTLRGQIKEVSLDEPGLRFSALSYHWGPVKETHGLTTDEGLVGLTGSLYLALQALRDMSSEVTLWVDAICINQNNRQEKRLQIRLMGEIYQHADTVIAWTGSGTESSDRAMEALLQIRTLSLRPPVWPSTLPPIPTSWAGKNCPSIEDDAATWEDIALFFERPWFSRVWVVQEVALASRVLVYCGGWRVVWDDAFEALRICIQERPGFLEDRNPKPGRRDRAASYALGILRQTYSNPYVHHRYDLLQLLELCSYAESTEPRDKLFALLSLASDAGDPMLDPDYVSPLEDVMLRYAQVFVERGNTMNLLYRAGTSKNSIPGCPSWIPDWTRESRPRTISTWRCRQTGAGFTATKDTTTRARIDANDSRVLVVAGSRVDRIKLVHNTTRRDVDAMKYTASLWAAISSNLSSRPYPTGETAEEVRQRLPIGDAAGPQLGPLTDSVSTCRELADGDVSSRLTGTQARGGSEAPWQGLLADSTGLGSIHDALSFFRQPRGQRHGLWGYWTTASAFSSRLSTARLCVTERGYLGLVPHDAVAGDSVVLIDGGAVPFVVRGCGDAERPYITTLVGECYVHGIMHGEAMGFGDLVVGELFLV
jgi:hypothetical protein